MTDPIAQFAEWLGQATAHDAIREPTAMTLATATAEGAPSARIVLLKEHGPEGFVFYTNFESRKGGELLENPRAALVFYWMPLERQVRIEGRIEPVGDAEADAYFASRERLKQAGAWASQQSKPMKTRDELTARIARIEAEYAGRPIPRPPHWSGFRVIPDRIEFWQQLEGRLHARDLYARTGQGSWNHSLLYP